MADTKAPWYKYDRHPTFPSKTREGTKPLPYYPPPKRERIPRPPKPRPARPMYTPRPGFSPRPPKPKPFIGPIDPRPRGPRPAVKPVSPLAKPPARLPIPRFPIPIPGFSYAEDFIPTILPNPNPAIPPRLPYNYYWCGGPAAQPNLKYISPGYFEAAGACGFTFPIIGQSNARYPGVALQYERHYWTRDYQPSFGLPRRAVLGAVERIAPHVGSPQPQPYRIVYMPPPNPNTERYMPVAPDPFAPYVPPRFQVGVGTAVPEPVPEPSPETAYGPDYQWDYQVGIQIPGRPGRPGNPTPPRVPPVTRDPPPKGEKQRKVLTRAAQVGIAVYKALDKFSEGAEVVDAVYDALPDDVKKRWKRPDRVGDSFGQYGLEGADWKLRALYYNWHRLDVVQAVKNIIKNGLSDSVVGGMHRGLPKNTGSAHSQSEKELSKLLDEWLSDELGL